MSLHLYYFAVLLAPLAVVIELVVARALGRNAYTAGGAQRSLGLFAGEIALTWLLRLNVFGMYALAAEHVRLVTWSSSSPWTWLAALVAIDFFYYWGHRVCHRTSVMWALHAVHHDTRDFNLGVGLAGPWLSALQIVPFVIPMAMLGFPNDVVLPIYILHSAYKLYCHSAFGGSYGILDRVFVSPALHRTHHSAIDDYLDRNYGGLLAVWDQLFGTYQPCAPRSSNLIEAIPGADSDSSVLEANVRPWRLLFNRMRAEPTFVGALRTAFGPPDGQRRFST